MCVYILSCCVCPAPVPLRTPELSLASLSPTDILVSWQPLSVKLSRGRILAYRLSFRTAADDDETALELPGDNITQHLLQDLQPDTIYLLRIAATTQVGWSQPSAWSSHRTPKTSSSTGNHSNRITQSVSSYVCRSVLTCSMSEVAPMLKFQNAAPNNSSVTRVCVCVWRWCSGV